MKNVLIKSTIYFVLIILALELLVRVFYLGKDTPSRILDENKVEKWAPNQVGFSVTGNRRQNFSEYRINSSGFNSYREFTPSLQTNEIAIVGDSFIEGFHQDYYNSIGKKIESTIQELKVYEYGYAGYDFADQLHLINAFKKDFDLIDHVFLGIKFSNDLTRSEYKVITSRLALESPLNKLLKKSKLLIYTKSIGILDAPKKLISNTLNLLKPSKENTPLSQQEIDTNKKLKDQLYLENFKNLVSTYGYDKNRFVLFLDSRITSRIFLDYLNDNNYKYIDFAKTFETTSKPKTLIYDKHWNNLGRELIAKSITEYLQEL